MRCISEFITNERERFDVTSNNLFSTAMGVIQKKYAKLIFLRATAMPLINEYGDFLSNPKDLDAKKIEEFNASNIQIQLEVQIESFFMYGTILCDEIAHLLLYYFGEARGIKMGSHRKLAVNFSKYADALSLKYNDKFIETAIFLEAELCDFRDKQLVHDFHPRKLDALIYNSEDEDVKLSYAMLYPKSTDSYVSSKNWGEVLKSIEDYLELVMDIIELNNKKIKLN